MLVVKQKFSLALKSVWVVKVGLSFLMSSISNNQRSNLLWDFLKILKWLSFSRWLLTWDQGNNFQLSSICVKQRVEKKGGGLYSPHNLHRKDHISNDEDVKRISILLPRTRRYAMLILKTCAMRELRSFFL